MKNQEKTTNLLGEFECSIDAKGRILLPSTLKKQIPSSSKNRFVINRGFEGCLVLYPKNEWEKESAELNKLNIYVKENREFIRAFMNGATELSLDGNSRLLFPKSLLEFANIGKEIILFAYSNRVEVWAKAKYKKLIKSEPEDFARLAEQVMGKKDREGGG